MSEWARGVMDELGYAGIALLVMLENVFPPIPSEVVVPFAGYATVSQGLSLAGVIAAATLGSVLGALPLYGLGRWLGRERIERFVDRHGAWLTVSPKELERSWRWFERRGRRTVLLCRLVPGLRSLISIPAGMTCMALAPFLLLTAIGTALWSAALAWIGRALGEHHDQVSVVLDPVLYTLLALALGTWIVRLVRQRRRRS